MLLRGRVTYLPDGRSSDIGLFVGSKENGIFRFGRGEPDGFEILIQASLPDPTRVQLLTTVKQGDVVAERLEQLIDVTLAVTIAAPGTPRSPEREVRDVDLMNVRAISRDREKVVLVVSLEDRSTGFNFQKLLVAWPGGGDAFPIANERGDRYTLKARLDGPTRANVRCDVTRKDRPFASFETTVELPEDLPTIEHPRGKQGSAGESAAARLLDIVRVEADWDTSAGPMVVADLEWLPTHSRFRTVSGAATGKSVPTITGGPDGALVESWARLESDGTVVFTAVVRRGAEVLETHERSLKLEDLAPRSSLPASSQGHAPGPSTNERDASGSSQPPGATLPATRPGMSAEDLEARLGRPMAAHAAKSTLLDFLIGVERWYGVKVLTAVDLDRPITADFEARPLWEALDTVLQPLGYAWIREGGAIRIVSADGVPRAAEGGLASASESLDSAKAPRPPADSTRPAAISTEEFEQRVARRMTAIMPHAALVDFLIAVQKVGRLPVLSGVDVDRPVSVSIENRPIREALEEVLRPLGYTWIRERDAIRIVTADGGPWVMLGGIDPGAGHPDPFVSRQPKH